MFLHAEKRIDPSAASGRFMREPHRIKHGHARGLQHQTRAERLWFVEPFEKRDGMAVRIQQ